MSSLSRFGVFLYTVMLNMGPKDLVASGTRKSPPHTKWCYVTLFLNWKLWVKLRCWQPTAGHKRGRWGFSCQAWGLKQRPWVEEKTPWGRRSVKTCPWGVVSRSRSGLGRTWQVISQDYWQRSRQESIEDWHLHSCSALRLIINTKVLCFLFRNWMIKGGVKILN